MGYWVYIHTNLSNGKKYIGLTTRSPHQRWGHQGNGYKNNTLFYSAIQKYGWDGFEHEVIECSSIEEMRLKEEELIKLYDSTNPDKGYNLTYGGEHDYHLEVTKQKISKANKGRPCSEEAKQKMRDHHADFRGEKHPRYGKPVSEETRKKISSANKNPSEATRKALSIAAKRRFSNPQNCANYGKHLSEETKRKISIANRGRHLTEEHKQKIRPITKPVFQYSLEGEFIREWGSIKEAADTLGICAVSISYNCKGKTKYAGGFIWKYKNNGELFRIGE